VNDRETRQDRLTLELLNAIDRNSEVSQRHLARNMGVALGLANSYLKRCARKGLIKISEAPANRCLYYLTPKGFAEKARLTGVYLSTSLTFYRQAAESCTCVFEACEREGLRRVLLCGVSDLAEIALLRARECGVAVTGIFDPRSERHRLLSKPVWAELPDARSFDVAVLTDLNAPLRSYEALVEELGKGRVWVPEVLGLGRLGAPPHADGGGA
jgi:DNA-binding MarR family transcriptional regulator